MSSQVIFFCNDFISSFIAAVHLLSTKVSCIRLGIDIVDNCLKMTFHFDNRWLDTERLMGYLILLKSFGSYVGIGISLV